jgi:hypothetical protein
MFGIATAVRYFKHYFGWYKTWRKRDLRGERFLKSYCGLRGDLSFKSYAWGGFQEGLFQCVYWFFSFGEQGDPPRRGNAPTRRARSPKQAPDGTSTKVGRGPLF